MPVEKMGDKALEITIDYGDLLQIDSRWEQGIGMNVQQAMQTAVMLVGGEAIRGAPAHEGMLRNSIQIDVDPMMPNAQGKIFTTMAHAPVLELGRRAGARQPPSEPLERWAQLVLRQPGLGYVIARSIGRKGMKGRFFFKAAKEKHEGNINDLFDRAVSMTMRNI